MLIILYILDLHTRAHMHVHTLVYDRATPHYIVMAVSEREGEN